MLEIALLVCSITNKSLKESYSFLWDSDSMWRISLSSLNSPEAMD